MIRFISISNSVDTLKMGLNEGQHGVFLDTLKDNATSRNTNLKTGIDKYIVHPTSHGISYITHNEFSGKTDIEVSAKVLGNDYRQGININNIERLSDAINATGVIEITTDELLMTQPYRVDVNQTIELSQLPKNAVDAMNLLKVQKGYQFAPYPKGITITRKAKSRNDRGNMYAKKDELLMASNKGYIKQFPKVLDTFTDNSFRIEHQLRKLEDIRKAYNIGTKDIELKQVLTASVNPVANYFSLISKDYNGILSKINLMSTSIKDAEAIAFLALHNYDIDATMQTVKGIIKGNPTKHRAKYKKLVTKMRANEAMSKGTHSLIQEIQESLLEAV